MHLKSEIEFLLETRKMKNVLVALIFVLASSLLVSAQSGRRVTATPAPTPSVRQEDPSQYSESKPHTPRTTRVAERFPGIGDGSNARPTGPPVATDAKDDTETLRIETNLITIPVSVFDRNGLYIPGLRQSDFKIYEDGNEQEIAYFGTSDKPFTVALLIDTSPSTAYKIDEIHRAAAAFVDQLEPQDSVIVIEFNQRVNVLTEATNDRQKIYKAINKSNFGDGTSLYNAVDEALRKQLGKVIGRKAVVLFTDGVDTTSRKSTYESTVNFAEESDSLVFPIYFNTFYDNNRRVNSPFPDIFGGRVIQRGTSSEEYALGRRYLQDLADVTGGRLFSPEKTPGGLTAAFEGIAEELRRQYNIGYVPTNEGKTGQRKQIKVRVDRANLIIRARDSYIVGSVAPAPTPGKPNK